MTPDERDKLNCDFARSVGWTDIHGGPPDGSFWRGVPPGGNRPVAIPDFSRLGVPTTRKEWHSEHLMQHPNDYVISYVQPMQGGGAERVSVRVSSALKLAEHMHKTLPLDRKVTVVDLLGDFISCRWAKVEYCPVDHP